MILAHAEIEESANVRFCLSCDRRGGTGDISRNHRGRANCAKREKIRVGRGEGESRNKEEEGELSKKIVEMEWRKKRPGRLKGVWGYWQRVSGLSKRNGVRCRERGEEATPAAGDRVLGKRRSNDNA